MSTREIKQVRARKATTGRSRLKEASVGCLFAAIGGFCKAFEQAGARVLWANEKDQYAKTTFEANFPEIRYLHKPVEELTVDGDNLEPVDILTAGFPCQPFSCAGEKLGFKDERGLLFLHIIRLIREFGRNKPKILLLENVQNFRTHDRGRTFKRVGFDTERPSDTKRKGLIRNAPHLTRTFFWELA